MTVSKKKLVVTAAVLLGSVSAAQAGFVTINTNAPVKETIGVVDSNYFKPYLAAAGVGEYAVGVSLGTDMAGSVTFYYYGKEAGYANVFSAGSLTKNSGLTPSIQNLFLDPFKIGSIDVTGGVFDFGFCAFNDAKVGQGCVTNAQNDLLNFGSPQSIAFSAVGNVAWIFWDDSGAGPDDNHDDMLIKAVFTPKSVPEPATLGLLGLGLLGTWFGSKRRQRKA